MLARLFFGATLAGMWLIGVVGGMTSVSLGTANGRNAAVGTGLALANQALGGSITVGSVGGSLVGGLDLWDVEIRDRDGFPLAVIEHLQLGYGIKDIVGGRIALGKLTLTRPRIDLLKRPGRRLNFDEIFSPHKSDASAQPLPAIAFRDVAITDATVVIRTPAHPQDSVAEVETGPYGPMRVRRIEGFNAAFPYVRIKSHLAGEDGIQFVIADLEGRLSDPELDVTGARGRVTILGDSVFLDLAALELPSSEASVVGKLVVGSGPLKVDLDIRTDETNTDRVRGLVAQLPAGMVAGGRFIIRSAGDDGVEFEAQDLRMRGTHGGGTIRGHLGMLTGNEGRWFFRNTKLDMENLDIEYIRGFFDTLPIAGRLTGRFEADGPRDSLRVLLNVTLRDSLVPGWPETTLDGEGIVSIGVPGEFVFQDFNVRHADLDLGSVRRLLPSVDLLGRLSLAGYLNDPWLQLAFDGELRYRGAPGTESVAHGTVRIDGRGDTLGVWSELVLDSLDLAGFETTYPKLGVSSSFAGRSVVTGYLDSLRVDANLEGPAGQIFLAGSIALVSPRRGAHSLDVRFARLDLAAVDAKLPRTRLAGRLTGSGMADTSAGTRANLHAVLRGSDVAGVMLDSARVAARVQDGLLYLDTLGVWGNALRISASGELGLGGSRSGQMVLVARSDSVGVLDTPVAKILGPLDSTVAQEGPPSGALAVNLKAAGSFENLEVSGDFELRDFKRGGVSADSLRVTGRWNSVRGDVALQLRTDSLELGTLEFGDINVWLAGRSDSLAWRTEGHFGPRGLGGWIASGSIFRRDGSYVIPIDTTGLRLASGAWFVDSGATVRVSEGEVGFSHLALSNAAGSGAVTIEGGIPRSGMSELSMSVEALPLQDIWMLLQWDYDNVGGTLGGTLSLEGSARDPRGDLFIGLQDGRIGDVRALQLLGSLNYQRQRLLGDVRLLRRGNEILNLRLRLPLDLALTEVDARRLTGPVSVQAVADGVDLQLINAMTDAVTESAGILDVDFGVEGTWEDPALTGSITIADGSARFPKLGVRHEDLNGRFVLSGDSIKIEQLSLKSGDGTAEISGKVRMEDLSRPILDVRIQSENFRAVNIRDFLSLTATADVQLRGPVFNATLTGRGTATEGILYFADLVTKDVVNLEDTLFTDFDLVDTTLIRTEGLGSAFENRFLDSLRIDSLLLDMGSDVWLRSGEANIELLGSVRVDKERDQYRLNGTMATPRGTYRLALGPSFARELVTREFIVTRGEVKYFGTPDLDAAIDIDARHVVRSVRGEDIVVMVHLGGTIYDPRLSFSSDLRPPISETEILSYLFFGAPSVEAFSGTSGSGNQRLVEQGLAQFLGALSGQLEYSLISDLGVPLDYVQIRPTVAATGLSGTEIALGKRLGDKWFLTLSPRLCARNEFFSPRNVGASLEYRFSRQWLFSVSGDPVQSCAVALPSQQLSLKYQIGADILWEKRY
ncbi:MAG: translocation/assembly module TamB domain-containing protein [Gemmatimonadales bacterium]